MYEGTSSGAYLFEEFRTWRNSGRIGVRILLKESRAKDRVTQSISALTATYALRGALWCLAFHLSVHRELRERNAKLSAECCQSQLIFPCCHLLESRRDIEIRMRE